MNKRIKEFLKDATENVLDKYNSKKQDNNVSGVLLGELQELGDKYGLIVEEQQIEHIDYGKTDSRKIEITDLDSTPVLYLTMNVHRHDLINDNGGTYEYNTYLSGNLDLDKKQIKSLKLR